MISQKLQNAINKQINAEMWSANLYLAMAFSLRAQGYDGMAGWLMHQAEEENEHAGKMADFLFKRGGRALVGAVAEVVNDYKDPMQAFEAVYAHERKVSSMIDALVALAQQEKDYAAEEFLRSFVREQIEEEDNAAGIVEALKLANGLYIFVDQKLGARK